MMYVKQVVSQESFRHICLDGSIAGWQILMPDSEFG